MTSPTDDRAIRWRIHLRSSPAAVYELLATGEGRRRFWAASADEYEGVVTFRFLNGQEWRSRILARESERHFSLTYFRGSVAAFELTPDGAGGTDLTLTETGVPTAEWDDNRAGWVSVLLALKGAADFGVDLRNDDPSRRWEQGYVDV